MTNVTHLDIVSVEKEIFSGLVQIVTVMGEMGELGIVAGHAPLLTVLAPGEVCVTKQDGSKEEFYVSGGMLEVQPYTVTVLADVAMRLDEITEEAISQAKQRAEELKTKQASTGVDYNLAAMELAQAVAEVRAIQKLRKKLHR
ncbi:MAG: F0F1 ATP synthase subunit epsilon [Legionellales bacterium RIFCSPHIGHO2_12_FULL_37_14]|nr:MAG: F0F1 ATP synthase subunit epsilon [Legionellales bacterium RIFCSPHIGHO2_12_FULL_37_14]